MTKMTRLTKVKTTLIGLRDMASIKNAKKNHDNKN